MTLRTRATVRTASSALFAVATLGALAGCSADAAGSGTAPAEASSGGSSSSGSSSSGSASSGTSSSAAADDAASASGATGTFTETGEYQTPGGRESVEVTLGVADGTVESVEVVGSGGSPNSQQYQGQFISGIEAEVVGTSLDTLEVGAVSGSSLTSQGFNAAVEKIRADAA